MNPSCTIPIIITKQQVIDFGNITGDNGSRHIVEGIVQAGLITSLIYDWSVEAAKLYSFSEVPLNTVTTKLTSKYKNVLYCDDPVNITFTYYKPKLKTYRIDWVIHDDIEYCNGSWFLYNLS